LNLRRYTKAQREGVTRFPNNPEENWGPKMRAGRPVPGADAAPHGTTKKQRTE
jgi:tRNA (guanine26-N2/guanine27-N2)-dimethyltransferase